MLQWGAVGAAGLAGVLHALSENGELEEREDHSRSFEKRSINTNYRFRRIMKVSKRQESKVEARVAESAASHLTTLRESAIAGLRHVMGWFKYQESFYMGRKVVIKNSMVVIRC